MNQDLYTDLAEEFSNSRDYYEPGWEIWKTLALPQELSILDLGCGNGRFGAFMAESFPDKQITYHGVDASQELLDIAKSETGNRIADSEFTKLDLYNLPVSGLQISDFNIIVMYAVMHHLPKLAIRRELLKLIAQSSRPDAYLHVSFWQFATNPRWQRRMSEDLSLVGMQNEEREHGDFVLDWKRGGEAYRYCHFADEQEILDYRELLAGQSQGLTLVSDYLSDGKEKNQNRYLLWQKS